MNAQRSAAARPVELKRVLSAAGRALAARGAGPFGWEELLDSPAPTTRKVGRACGDDELSSAEIRVLRGRVDAQALHVRHHDPHQGDVMSTAGEVVATLLAALEEVRVQALGARVMPGVADNLRELLQRQCTERGYHTIQHRREVPLLDALAFHVRAIVAPQTLPPAAMRVLSAWADILEPLTCRLRERLVAELDEQELFAATCAAMIAGLGHIEGDSIVPVVRRPLHSPALQAEDLAPSEAQRESLSASVPFAGNQGLAAVSVERRTPTRRVRTELDQGGVSDGRADFATIAGSDAAGYRVFDATCDVVRDALELRPAEELARLRARLDELVVQHSHLVARLANRLRRSLLALERQDWTRDLDEGGLDTSRLARAVADPAFPLSYRQQRDVHTRDTVVSVLIDNSGSMAGTPIETAAVCADILARTLERCGVRSEILGFTTAAWKGGQVRERWVAAGRPPHPGRLNELLHIVYKSAETSWRRARDGLGLMLDASLLKENIDGEAVLWAHQRLLARPERRRILIVVSDGEPADETSRDANGAAYLERHLRRVIAAIESRSPVHLCAIGVGHDVTRHYRRSLTIDGPGQLGDALAGQLARVLGEDGGNTADGRSVAQARWRAGHWQE
ncbi:MAG: cobaltochelatase subunit CobT [Pseudomonadales bacterium]|jgi:cobaltochelatase CobT|nr:hypothetical protein [Pseudomonadales bacterium]MCP5320425.1 cobaltochelatase subunit CobT [Pseudomonadales bacterium]MCP5336817.1 cobaltochelatase subunit CobT [Pseudomonadales bacterium]